MRRVHHGRGHRHRVWSCLVVTVAAGALAAAALADANVIITGASATDTQDCRNQANPPRPRGSQVNVCDATATGGSVALNNVDIYFYADSTFQANGGVVDVVHASGGAATASAQCQNTGTGPVHQISICIARATGGNVRFDNVQILVEHADGSVSTVRRTLRALASSRASRVTAVCTSQSSAPVRCDGTASGGTLLLTDVDVVDHEAGTTRTHVNVSVTGGAASATVLCTNAGGSSGPRVQLNKCSATATGGDVSLQDVRLHVYEASAAR